MTDATEFVVAPEDEGTRLDTLVARQLDVGRTRAATLVDEGAVTVDGHPQKRSAKVAAGQRIEIAAPAHAPAPVEIPPLPPVRYRDEHLLVVAKPAGLVVHPGAGTPTGTLVDALRGAGIPLAAAGGRVRPGIVHRLDKDTSGLLVVASSDEAHRGMVAALKRRDVERRYLTLVEGRLPTTTGRIDAPIGRDPRDRMRFACVATGKPAVTHWEVQAEGRVPGLDLAVSLVACRLETGRTHQIRVHLSYAGTPVVADRTYRGRGDVAEALALERLFLHAHALSFTHPVTGAPVAVTEPLPADLARAADVAGVPAG